MDSGSMRHFINTKDGVANLDLTKKISVLMADQSKVRTHGSGSFGPLPDVHYRPNFGAPLLSIPKLYEDGMATVYHLQAGIFVADADKV
jgi:hypothetical protein